MFEWVNLIGCGEFISFDVLLGYVEGCFLFFCCCNCFEECIVVVIIDVVELEFNVSFNIGEWFEMYI